MAVESRKRTKRTTPLKKEGVKRGFRRGGEEGGGERESDGFDRGSIRGLDRSDEGGG